MVQATVKEFDNVPAGNYPAQFNGISEFEGTFGPSWNWEFAVATSEGIKTVTDLTSTNFSANSKAYKWYSGITGNTPAPGDVVDFDALLGARCTLTLGVNEKGYNKIQLIVRDTAPAAAPAAPAPAAPTPTVHTPPTLDPFNAA